MTERNPIPAFSLAIEALSNCDKDTLEIALFPFEIDDGHYFERIKIAVRNLLKRPDIIPRQIVSVGRLLYGIARFPLRTPGLDISLSLVSKFGGEATVYGLFLNEYRFSTKISGYINSGFGTDSFSEVTYEVEGHRRRYEGWNIFTESWPDVFNEMELAELDIQDESQDDLIDWSHPDGSEFWGWIANHR
jgi:hypothetical protein